MTPHFFINFNAKNTVYHKRTFRRYDKLEFIVLCTQGFPLGGSCQKSMIFD